MGVQRERFVILLRGINVGGHKKVPMAQLRTLCESLGCDDVETYVQSGNVVTRSALSAEELAADLESALNKEFGFTPRVIIREHSDFIRVLDNNPYPDTEEKFLHVGFMAEAPTKKAIAALGTIDCAPEGYTIAGREIYLNFVNGAGRSPKLGRIPFERKLAVDITSRNLRTVTKLAEMSAP
jgi:uncharacterized protein (DUF1697 family)